MTADRFSQLQDVSGPVSRETFERLGQFEREFRRWAQRINLAAPSTLDDLWSRHIMDSAQLMALKPDATRWLDLGSGGGFPGVVVAILLADRPGSHIDLIESNNKKAAFLRTILSSLGCPATVHVARIEEAAERVDAPEIVTARALARLPLLLKLASPWLFKGASGLFHKGRDYGVELVECHDEWRFDLVEHVSKVDPQSRVLEISGLVRQN